MEEAKVRRELYNSSLLISDKRDGTSGNLSKSLEIVRDLLEEDSSSSLQANDGGSFYCDRYRFACPLRNIV